MGGRLSYVLCSHDIRLLEALLSGSLSDHYLKSTGNYLDINQPSFNKIIFLYNQLKFTDMFQSSVLTFQCVLHFMVGSTEGTEGVSKDIIDVLLNAGLMTM